MAALLAACALAVAGCGGGDDAAIPGADPSRAQEVSDTYGCGACHTIGGLRDASGRVGPELTGGDGHRAIAGRLPRTPGNLQRWIRTPQEIAPGSLMPDMGVTERDARDIAAYLSSH
ncbi:MAG: c-type cytochrome [Thermoleophilia bacterium]|nr:c-type cytochrome [Thermoleophilia bacterium]